MQDLVIMKLAGCLAICCALSTSTSGIASEEQKTPPKSTGSPNICGATSYPAAAIRTGAEGEAVIGFDITVEGTVKNLHIIKSTGNNDLDQASLACATGWRYQPAMLDNKPVETPWQAKITWSLSGGASDNSPGSGTGVADSSETMPRLTRSIINPCPNYSANSNSVRDDGKNTVLQYRVTTGGRVENAFVAISSGDSDFDAMALQCISNLQYQPGTMGGKPTDRPWGAAIGWVPHAGLVDFEGSGKWHICGDEFYPAAEKAAKTEGATNISFHIVPPGTVQDVHVELSSGNTSLDQAAMACAAQWKYRGLPFGVDKPDLKQVATVFWRGAHVFVLEFNGIRCLNGISTQFCKK